MRDETRMKPAGVKIIQIIDRHEKNYVYGLGDDSRVYIWLVSELDWMLSG